jgi:glutathione peroxidase-family protein
MEEIPNLIDIQKKFSPQGFSVIGLSVDQGGPAGVERLVKKKEINYPVLMADAETMQNFGGVYGIPVSFLVNKAGNVVKKYTGYVPPAVLINDIKNIME